MRLQNLFIFNFDKSMKLRRIGIILVICLLILLMNSLLNYAYYDEYEWGRKLWHDYYGTEENIDNVFIGSSHVYYDVNPFLLDELTGKCNYNLASGSLCLNAAYYMLKEVIKKHEVEHVYLEMYYYPSTGVEGNYGSAKSIKNGWKITDYMKPSFNKLQALFILNDVPHLGEAFFPFIRYRNYLFDADYIKKITEKKQTDNYLNYEYIEEEVEYWEKGYLYSQERIDKSQLAYKMQRKPDEMYVTEDAQIYLRKIIELCQKEGIKITLFSSPTYELRMLSTADTYDQYARKIFDIAREYQIEYYDFNLCKEEYLPVQYEEWFADTSHLNACGAEMFTQFLYKIMSQNKEENQIYFYDSYKEKIANAKPCVYGLYYENNPSEEMYCRYQIAATPMDGLEYKIYIAPNEGKEYLYQNFSKNKNIMLPKNEDGICRIIYREAGEMMVQELEVTY